MEATLGRSSFDHLGHHCNWASAAPCPSGSHLVAPLGIADLPDGVHTMRVTAYDAALNAASVSRGVHVDNTAPEPVVPAVVGGDAWRRTNEFVATWTNPPNQMAPIVRVHWKLCAGRPPAVCSGARNSPALRARSGFAHQRRGITASICGSRTPPATSERRTLSWPFRFATTPNPLL